MKVKVKHSIFFNHQDFQHIDKDFVIFNIKSHIDNIIDGNFARSIYETYRYFSEQDKRYGLKDILVPKTTFEIAYEQL